MSAVTEIEMYQGDNRDIRVTLKDANGVSVGETSGWRLRFTVKEVDTDAATVIFKDSDVATEAAYVSENLWDIYILRADTASLTGIPKTYVFDVEMETDDSPVKYHTAVKGSFKIRLGVTA